MEITKILMDTSAYSAFLRGNTQIKQILQKADEIYLNPIIIGELLAGFSFGKKEKQNRSILQDFLLSSRVNIIDIDVETTERYAVIYRHLRLSGKPIPANDLWIAASAMQYGLKVITLDRHFLEISQIITEYFGA